MTPDDTSIPEDDAIARAARNALRHLADNGSIGGGSWDEVRAGARRVRQRRVAAAGAAVAIVLVAAGTAFAVTGPRDRRAPIAGPEATSTTSEPSTTTTEPVPTMSAPFSQSGATSTTSSTPAAPPAQPNDFAGTITLASTTLVAEQATPVALTVRNVTDHPVSLPGGLTWIGVYIDVFANAGWSSYNETPFAPGEERTFTATITPQPHSIGMTQISAAFLTGIVMDGGANVVSVLPGVASVPITIVPPGWTPGQPLDPSQGLWRATVSTDATDVRVGEPFTVHATVRNVGDQPQMTDGYASLSLVCTNDRGLQITHLLGPATLAPDAEQTFSAEFRFDDRFVDEPGTHCFVGIDFHDDDGYAYPRPGIESDSAPMNVLPASGTTTTTAPESSDIGTP